MAVIEVHLRQLSTMLSLQLAVWHVVCFEALPTSCVFETIFVPGNNRISDSRSTVMIGFRPPLC